MFKLIKKSRKRLSKMQHGQVLVVVAFAIVGIVAIMGLARLTLQPWLLLYKYARAMTLLTWNPLRETF